MKSKNRIIAAFLILLVVVATGCHHRHNRKRTVRVNSDNSSLKIEYSGNIRFNEEQTVIEKISPRGYVKYRKDGKSFTAESDKWGIIHYRINNNEDDENESGNSKLVSEDVIQEIAMHYRK